MCGIAGFFNTKNELDRREISAIGDAMAKAIAHRGPDDQGAWQDPDLPLCLVHRRLSIIDLSEQGHQPMESASGRYMIVYNGEIYNFQPLMADLEAQGIIFRGRSDTEVMLAAFEQWGVNLALQKLGGMFAFALWDRKEKILHLIRDRLGKKPLYVGWAGGDIVFGSELKALHAHPGFRPAINRNALALFMRYGYIPAPYTIYENVWQLLPGARMALNLSSVSKGNDLSKEMVPYWNHPRVVEEAKQRTQKVSDKQVLEDFENLLKECVGQRMISDVPLGAFLSGGVDSSAVVALMQAQSERPVKTFSIGFKESGYDEAVYAKKIAGHLGTEHYEHYMKPKDALDVIPKLATMYDEPFADVSQIPTHLVSAFAREHVAVALSGDGGDEMLGGYLRHYVVPDMWRRVGWMPLPVRKAMNRGIRSVSTEKWNRIVKNHPQFGERLYKIAELLPMKGAEEIYGHLVSQWRSEEHIVRNADEPIIPLTDPSWQPRGLGFAETMMYGDALSYLPNDVLTKVDRASMAVALETRAPLLDYRVFEYCWSLPHKFKVRDGKGKWLLRKMLAKYVPEKMFVRPKQGFTVPLAEWLRGPLKGWAEELLDKKKMDEQGYLDSDIIRKAWDEHLAGRGRHAHRLWTVLMFQSWHDRWSG